MTPPDGSSTFPVMPPTFCCAKREQERNNSRKLMASKRRFPDGAFMEAPPSRAEILSCLQKFMSGGYTCQCFSLLFLSARVWKPPKRANRAEGPEREYAAFYIGFMSSV